MRRRESGLAILALVSLVVAWLWVLPLPLAAAGVAAGATLSILDEPVAVTRLDGLVVAAVDGQSLAEGEVVRVGVGGRALLTFFDGSTAELGSEAVMIVERAERGTGGESVLELWQAGGMVVHRVAALLRGSAYQVHTPSSVAMVRGTVFRTSVAPASRETGIEVFRGVVQVAGHVGEPVRVQSGETTAVGWQRSPRPPAPNPLAPPDEQPPRRVAPPEGPAPHPIARPIEDRPRLVPAPLKELVGDAARVSPPAGGISGFEWEFLVGRHGRGPASSGQGSPALEGTVLDIRSKQDGQEPARLAIVAGRDGDVRAVVLSSEAVAQVASPATPGQSGHGPASASPAASASQPASDRLVATSSPASSGRAGAGPSPSRHDAAQGLEGTGESAGGALSRALPPSSSAAAATGPSQAASPQKPAGGGSLDARASGAQPPSQGASQGDAGKSSGSQGGGAESAKPKPSDNGSPASTHPALARRAR